MKIVPKVSVARFEKLQPGDLFIFLLEGSNCVGVKTDAPPNGDPNEIALLGPSFPDGIKEPFLIPWQGATCVAFGQNYSVLLPGDPSGWSDRPPPREILCLARLDDEVYVRVNGDKSGRGFFPCYVNLASGAVVENVLKGISAYALQWEFIVSDGHLALRSILKFPY